MSAIHRAETAFRWLMLAYPVRFRQTHGLALFELFRDEARQVHQSGGGWALARLVVRAVADTARNAPLMWLDRSADREGVAVAFVLSGVLQDCRVATRQLRRSPGFTLFTVVMLAAGIGANATIFSLANALLLRPLAAHDPERVVRLSGRTASGALASRFSYPDFADYRERATTVDELGAVDEHTFVLADAGASEEILGEVVTPSYLHIRGARAIAGRTLTEADDRPGAPAVALVSDALWRRRFGGAPGAIGRQVLLNGAAYVIVGVASSTLTGNFPAAPIDIWVPVTAAAPTLGAAWNSDRSRRRFAMIARLGRGVTAERCRGELQIIAGSLVDPTATQPPITRIAVEPGTLLAGRQRILARMFLSLLFGLTGLVLLVACANVANLMLARVLGRRRELAIRVALGAGRGRLARMLIVESLLLSACGGVAAACLSTWTTNVFAAIRILPTLSLRLDTHMDVRVAAFIAGATVASAIVLACVGASQALRPVGGPALKEDAAGAIGGRSPMRLRGLLASAQVAISLMLLIGAALFGRSVRHAETIELGFEPKDVVVLDVSTAGRRQDSRRFFDDALRRMSAQATVGAVAVSTRAPLDSSTPSVRVSAREAVTATGASSATASYLVVSSRYFDVVRTPLIAGRPFTEGDDEHAPAAVIVNETLAARLWPGHSPLGERLWLDPQVSRDVCFVVGVARNAKYVTLGEEQQGHVYLPFAQHPRDGMAVLIRSIDVPSRAIAQVQAVLRTIDPSVQGFFARTLAEHVAVATAPVRLAASLAAAVAALAMALAAVGLYGLVAFLVAERTHEIGLRMALGATAADVFRLVLGYGVKLAAVGVALGIPAAIGTARLAVSLLYGVSPADPTVFLVGSVTVLAVAAIACYVPARRAVSLDPLVALKGP